MILRCLVIIVFWEMADTSRRNDSILNLSATCGIQQTVAARRPRIIGGVNARSGEWPWQVALLQIDPRDGNLLDHHCGGVLVHRNWILTSAHCLVDPYLKFVLPPPFWRVEVGKTLSRNTSKKNLKSKSEPESSDSVKNRKEDYNQDYQNEGAKFQNDFEYEYFDNFKVERIYIHQDFDRKTWSNDLALLKLSIPEETSRDFVPVCLPDPNSSFVGQSCSVSGWGQTSLNGPYSKKLKTISVTILNEEQCKQSYKNIDLFSENMFCAGDLTGLTGPCVGDSGSPLQCFNEETQQWVLSGITSWGYSCAKEEYPAVYMKVANYLDWINKILLTL